MPKVLWTGRLSPQMKFMMNTSNLVAWAVGSMRNTEAMKERMKQGYDGAFSEHVNYYDQEGLALHARCAAEQLKDVDVRGQSVLDIGGGTGISSFVMLRRGAAHVTCGDISEHMLAFAREKAEREGYGPERMGFRQLDAETLPYGDESFDAVSTSMTMGFLPNQDAAMREMARVVRPGGLVTIGTQGPDHYWEPIEATLRTSRKRYMFGYRLEFWPQTESEVRKLMESAGLVDVESRRVTWQKDFGSGGKVFDFFAAVSASWWYGRFPPDRREEEAARTRAGFERLGARTVTGDIIVASGRKPG